MFWKYLANFRSVAWLNLFGENINGKLFAVCDDSYLHNAHTDVVPSVKKRIYMYMSGEIRA
jgi:hypothetical protein